VQGLEIPGQHLKVRAKIDGKMIERAFTPTSKFSQVTDAMVIARCPAIQCLQRLMICCDTRRPRST